MIKMMNNKKNKNQKVKELRENQPQSLQVKLNQQKEKNDSTMIHMNLFKNLFKYIKTF